MIRRIRVASGVFAFGALGLLACSGAPPQDAGEAAGDAVAPPTTMQRTVVVLNADGTRTVTAETITAETHASELAARAALKANPGQKSPELVVGGCGMADLILYNYVNGGTPAQGNASCPAELCFYNNDKQVDSIYLPEYKLPAYVVRFGEDGKNFVNLSGCYGTTTWDQAVQSVQSGESQDACISGWGSQTTPCHSIFAGIDHINLAAGWDDENVPASWAGDLDYVYLDYGSTSGTRAWCSYAQCN
jgi:hypothetical protein